MLAHSLMILFLSPLLLLPLSHPLITAQGPVEMTQSSFNNTGTNS